MFASGEDRVDRLIADPLDRREAHPQMGVIFDLDPISRSVDVDREHLDPDATRLGNRLGERADRPALLRRLILVDGHQRGHELRQEVGLEIRLLIGGQGVGGGVALIERVGGEGGEHRIPVVFDKGTVDTGADRTIDELVAILREQPGIFLRCRLTEPVRLGEGEGGEIDRQEHHLLLVDEHPVGLFKDRARDPLKDRVTVFALPGGTRLDVLWDILHRARPTEGGGDHQVLHALGLHLLEDPGREI